MRRPKKFLPAMVAAVCVLAIADAAPVQANEPSEDQRKKTAELLKVLETDGLTAAKAAAFEDLAVVGTGDAIPVLAPLLADKELAHYARYALEMNMCKNALAVAERDDERKLVLTVLERNPSPISLGLAVTLLDHARLKNQAANVALSIAERTIEEDPKPVADAMRKVVDAGVRRNLENRAKAYLERAQP